MSRDKNYNVPNYPNESFNNIHKLVLAEQIFLADFFLLLFSVQIWQPLVLGEFFCKYLFICLFVYLFLNFEMSFKHFDIDRKPHSFNEDFQSTLYPLVKYYFAAFYQDNLLPSILAVCINIFLFPTHKCITSEKGKSFIQRLYAHGC